MTIDERLNRIEHFTAGMAEERKRDRETDRALWRDTQRQLSAVTEQLYTLTLKVAATSDAIANLSDELRASETRSETRDKALGERINALVSAIGQIAADYDRRLKALEETK